MNDVSGETAPRTRLGWRAERRPAPGFAHVLGAGAGAFVVFAVVAFVAEAAGSDDPTGPGVVLDLLLAVVAFVVGFRATGPLRAAATTALVLSVPIVWVFAFLGGGSGDRGAVTGVYLLTIAVYAVLYLAGWTRGRAVLLAGALLLFSFWIAFEVAGDSGSVVPFSDQVSSTPFSTDDTFGSSGSSSLNLGSTSDTSDTTATVILVVGLVMLGAGAALDRRKLAGAATPFIAVGAIDTLVGAIALGGNDSAAAGGALAALAGAVIGFVGSRGENRRGSVWVGGLAIAIGLLVIVADAAGDSTAGFGGLALLVAAVLGLAAWWLAPRLGEPDDGDRDPAGPRALVPGPPTAELPTVESPGELPPPEPDAPGPPDAGGPPPA